MTREEAVNELNDRIELAKYVDSDYIDYASVDAVKMAISALSVPETNVGETISRQSAIDAADRADYTGLAVEDVKKVTDEVVKEIKKLPSAQSELENKILTIGYTGKEGRIYIGGRLFAVRELAQ